MPDGKEDLFGTAKVPGPEGGPSGRDVIEADARVARMKMGKGGSTQLFGEAVVIDGVAVREEGRAPEKRSQKDCEDSVNPDEARHIPPCNFTSRPVRGRRVGGNGSRAVLAPKNPECPRSSRSG